MNYRQYLNNTTKTWLLADGGGGTKLGPGCAKQTPGNPAILSLNPSGKPYMDAYWYLMLGPQKAGVVIYDLHFKFPTAKDLQSSQAVEFEFRDDSISEEEDGGWQGDLDLGFWRYYDFRDGRWVNSGIGLPGQSVWLAGVDVGAVYSITQGQTANDGVMFQGLLVNGVWHDLSKLEVAVHTTTSPKFNMAVQLDSNQHGDAYSCEVATADLRLL